MDKVTARLLQAYPTLRSINTTCGTNFMGRICHGILTTKIISFKTVTGDL